MKIGDRVKILERHYQDKRYALYEIIDIYNKGMYDMYLCKNLKSGCKTTFTDKDLKLREHCYMSRKQIVEVDV